MNRRHKKPQQTDYLAKVQNYWQQLDWPRYRQQLHALWLRLPPFHRRGLMVLTPAVLVLMVILCRTSKTWRLKLLPRQSGLRLGSIRKA